MNERLIEFLKKHLERGSDMKEVKQALLSAGHDIYTVEEHMNHVLKYKKAREFIKKHIEIGSDIEKVKQALLNAGYDINIVEEQLRNALEDKSNRRHKLVTPTLSIAVLIIAVIISAAGFYYFSNLYKKTDLTINESRIENIKYQKNLEIFNKALIANDTDVCGKIEDSELRNDFKKRFEFDLNKTEEKTNFTETADKKILDKALVNHNLSICSEIADALMKGQCEQILIR